MHVIFYSSPLVKRERELRMTLCFCPHSVSWLRPVQTQSASLNCAGTTTRSKRLRNFTVSWSSRSSKPSRSPSLNPTVISSPPLDQDFTLFRHWKNRQTLCLQQTYFFNYSTFCPFLFCFPVSPFFSWGRGGNSGERVGNVLKKGFYCTTD